MAWARAPAAAWVAARRASASVSASPWVPAWAWACRWGTPPASRRRCAPGQGLTSAWAGRRARIPTAPIPGRRSLSVATGPPRPARIPRPAPGLTTPAAHRSGTARSPTGGCVVWVLLAHAVHPGDFAYARARNRPTTAGQKTLLAKTRPVA